MYDESIQCGACKFGFCNASLLLRHLRNLVDDDFHRDAVFSCHICLNKIGRCYEFVDHLSTHQIEEIPSTSSSSLLSIREKKQTCLECGIKTKYESELKKHLLIHKGNLLHGIVQKLRFVLADKPFKCSKCGASFTRRFNLKQHAGTHNRQATSTFECSVCQKSFFSRSALKLHFRIHNNIAPIECEYNGCKEHFRTKKLMVSHIKRAHLSIPLTNKKEYSASEAQRVVQKIAELSGKTINEDPPLQKSANSAFSSLPVKRLEIERHRQIGRASLSQNNLFYYGNCVQVSRGVFKTTKQLYFRKNKSTVRDHEPALAAFYSRSIMSTEPIE